MVVTLAGLIAYTEADRLIAGAIGEGGISRSLTGLTAVTGVSKRSSWEVWAGDTTSDPQSIARWIAVAAVLEIAFYVGYLLLLRRWVRSDSRVAVIGLRCLWAAEVAETLLLLVAATLLAGGTVPDLFRWVLVLAGVVKWGALLVVLLAAVRSPQVRGRATGAVLRAVRALRLQRSSLLIVVVLVALSLVPSRNLFDQFPDVLRGWFDGTYHWAGVHFTAGVVSYFLAGLALFFLGRQRSERAWTTRVRGTVPQVEASYFWWFPGPVVAAITAMVIWSAGRSDLVDVFVLAVFLAVPLALVFVSSMIRSYHCRNDLELWHEGLAGGEQSVAAGASDGDLRLAERRQGDRRADRRLATDVWVTGDLLAVAVPVIGALSLVRALAAPVVLDFDARTVHWVARLVALVLSVAVIGWGFRAADGWARQLHERSSGLADYLRPEKRTPGDGPLRRLRTGILWLVAIGLLLALVLFPIQLGTVLGVVATAVLSLTAWTVVFGLLIVQLQHERPLEVFRWLRMRANPVLTLFVVVPFVVSFWGGVAGLHALRSPDVPTDLVDRPTLDEWFTRWERQTRDCATTVGGEPVRPLVLVAASGGGIRAAYWTQGALQQLDAKDGCATSRVFLSSGVSGGSVGLVVSRGDDAEQDLLELSRPEGLAAALAGLFVGDLVAGTSGLRVPSIVHERTDWRDRAGLMETVWERDVPQLAEPFDARPVGPAGMLVLNSTSTSSGCRVLVSQVRFEPGVAQVDREARRASGRPTTCRRPSTCRTSTRTAPRTCPGPQRRCCRRGSRR